MPVDKQALMSRCTRSLQYHLPARSSPRAVLRALADAAPDDLVADAYGEGPVVGELEGEIAELLGKEAAVFLPSGTMAQQIALRIWAERRPGAAIAFHPTCHLELHEHKAYERLHGLGSVLVGDAETLVTTAALEKIAEPIGALLLELPQRGIGGQLPSWDELASQADWARRHGTALHMDGARLWESQPFYGKPYREIARDFDSVYVSFYKILGGIAGAALAGPRDFIAEARIWQRRHGGELVHAYPLVLSARAGLRERLPRIGAYCERARALALELAKLPALSLVPDPPHANMFHVFVRGDRQRIEAGALDFARDERFWVFGGLQPTRIPTLSTFEVTVGDGALALSVDEAVGAVRTILTRAGAI